MSFNIVIMVVSIVLITSFTRIYMAKHGLDKRGRRLAGGMPDPVATAEADRARDEIRALKDRIAVLERLATDNNSALALDREIEKLR